MATIRRVLESVRLRLRLLLKVPLLAAAILSACRPSAPVARLRISPPSVRLGYPESALVRFDWRPIAALDGTGSPTVFVHLLDEKGGIRRTFDHPFPQAWSPGRPVSYDLELYQSALGSPLPPGAYAVTAGLYEPGSGRRWALETGGKESGRREYRVGSLDVPPADAAAPARFEFEGEWGGSEPDPSLQVLARRRLEGPASLRFAGKPGIPGAVRIAITVHGAPLDILSDCATAAVRLDPGYHWIGFELPASGTCSIRFPGVASRHHSTGESLDAASLHAAPATSLDVASWTPASR